MAFPTPAGPLKFGFQNVQPPADAGGSFDIADRAFWQGGCDLIAARVKEAIALTDA